MELVRVPLHGMHAELGARMTPFSGFEMPLLYKGILDEHRAVRTSWGVFDVSHMSDLEVPAADAAALARAVAWEVGKLAPWSGKYTVACRADGTILDDLIVYRLEDRFHVVPNAGMNGPVGDHLRAHGARVEDRSRATCIIAVQGPRAPELGPAAIGLERAPARFKAVPFAGGFASGTGYTGERGFELFVPNERAAALWRTLVGAGAAPCGLGARDTLRMEKGYCLAGNEFAPPRTPLESSLAWAIDLDHAFTGRDAILRQRDAGVPQRLCGLELTDAGIPRRGHAVKRADTLVGTVSSGTQSPLLGRGIALAYVRTDLAEPGTDLEVEVRPGRTAACRVTKLPFL